MWIAEVPILSDAPLLPFKSFGGWREVHRSGRLWKRAPSLGFLVGCWTAFQAHMCRYPLDINFIQRADSWQNSPNGTKRRVCLACRSLTTTPATTTTTTYHVPDVVGQPVDDAVEAGNNLKVLGFDRALVDQKDDKRSRHKWHRANSKDCDQNIWALLTRCTVSHTHSR